MTTTENRSSTQSAGSWMYSNLITQGYRISRDESDALSLALRFSTGLCLLLVLTALALESPAMVFALSGIGLVAGFGEWHPFDHLWNRVVRHAVGGLALPPNPSRRRHGFKAATLWLAAIGGLLSAGATTAALVLGVLLLAGCGAATTVNLCLASEALAYWERRGSRSDAAALRALRRAPSTPATCAPRWRSRSGENAGA